MAVGTVDKDAIRRAQADIVVTVKAVLWCDALEHCGHVAEQRWIVLVDDEGSRRVKSLNVDDAGPDLRCFDKSADLVGQVDELRWMLRLDPNGRMPERRCACERFHVISSWSEDARLEARSLQRSVSVS